tara:strand:+ start:211 stop:525 length:315 start_codon:yes stop_codon:yes gene_type:complete
MEINLTPSKESEMNTYHVVRDFFESENTAEFGFGDFPKRTSYIDFSVKADTKRKAMHKAKKIDSRVKFAGIFGEQLFEDDEVTDALRAATARHWINFPGYPHTS